jgi:hypothetical protein
MVAAADSTIGRAVGRPDTQNAGMRKPTILIVEKIGNQ